jgi:hypothetical protein
MDVGFLPPRARADVKTFVGNAVGSGDWQAWFKPKGCTMASIVLVGAGGNGGNGAIGANSTAAGGGGGASGAVSKLLVPLCMLPDILYLQLRMGGSGGDSRISIAPNGTTNHLLLVATAGGNGGNASGATAGAAGTAASSSTVGAAPLSGLGISAFLGGQAGIIGGTTVSGGALTLPVTGIFVTGGTGGGGLPAAGVAGTAGGSFTTPSQPTIFAPHVGGAGGSAATAPPVSGSGGPLSLTSVLKYGYGGTGGGSTHGSATGAGLVQSSGGNGAYGCGGGGSGGALTGSTPGVAGIGGPAYCVIVCW